MLRKSSGERLSLKRPCIHGVSKSTWRFLSLVCCGILLCALVASPLSATPKDKNKKIAAVGVGAVYAGVGLLTYFAWYHNTETLPEFTVGGDGYFGRNTYAGGADKFGHAWGTHAIAHMTANSLKAGGYSPMVSSVWGASLSLAFFTYIEIKDGFFYQFSPGDAIGNTLGAGLQVLFTAYPGLDALFDYRVDYFPTSLYRQSFKESGDINFMEDYSGQTYHVALHLSEISGIAENRWTRPLGFLDAVVGFGSRNYKPEPTDASLLRKQNLFFGVALNFQAILSALYGHSPSKRATSLGHRIGHSIFEHVSVPYTTLPLLNTTRSTPQ